MNSKKIKVRYSFLNKKNVLKSVNFKMDEQLYKDIMKLPKEEKDYWMQFYYHEYCNERNQNRKEFRNREMYLSVDYNFNNEEDEFTCSVNKIAQIADPVDVEQNVINKCIVEEILSLLDETEKYIVINVLMHDVPKMQVARELGITDTAVNKKIIKIKNKITSHYKYK